MNWAKAGQVTSFVTGNWHEESAVDDGSGRFQMDSVVTRREKQCISGEFTARISSRHPPVSCECKQIGIVYELFQSFSILASVDSFQTGAKHTKG